MPIDAIINPGDSGITTWAEGVAARLNGLDEPQTFYVSPAGSGADGKTPGSAYTTIQAAYNATSGYGVRRIIVLPGTYPPFTINNAANTQIIGQGTIGQDSDVGSGQVIIDVPSGQWGASVDIGASSEVFQGLEMKNLYFKGVSGSLGGVRIGRHSNFVLDRIGAGNFPSGTGIRIEGADSSQYGTLRDPQAFDCLIGIDVVNHNGLRIFGGTIEYLGGPVTRPAGSIGVRGQSAADALRLFGTVVQFVETGITVAGEGSVLDSPRLEAFTKGVVLDGHGAALMGGSFNNYILGDYSGTTAIEVKSTAVAPIVFPNEIAAVATSFTDLRSTSALRADRTVFIQGEHDAKLVRFPNGAFMAGGDLGGAVKSSGILEANTHVVAGSGDYSAKFYLGGDLTTNIYRVRTGDVGVGGAICPSGFDRGIRYGDGAPSSGLGFDGDLYIRSNGTVGSNIYKKAAGAWTAIL